MCRSDSSSLSAASPLQGAPGPQASDIVEKPGKEHLLFPQNSPHLLLSVKDDKVLLDSFKAFLEIVIFLLKNRKEPHMCGRVLFAHLLPTALHCPNQCTAHSSHQMKGTAQLTALQLLLWHVSPVAHRDPAARAGLLPHATLCSEHAS